MDQYTLEAFAEFCEKQPADKEYDYCTAAECAVAQYLSSIKAPKVKLNSSEIDAMFGVTVGNAVVDEPHTFSALAKRLRETAP